MDDKRAGLMVKHGQPASFKWRRYRAGMQKAIKLDPENESYKTELENLAKESCRSTKPAMKSDGFSDGTDA